MNHTAAVDWANVPHPKTVFFPRAHLLPTFFNLLVLVMKAVYKVALQGKGCLLKNGALTPVILATWEAEIGRLEVWGQSRQRVPKASSSKLSE
jgi:hypothetical protein